MTGDERDIFDVDYSRIVHSGSFRRLQGKTQILNLGDSDFYRTRLTHSLEVAQVAGGLVKNLKKSTVGHPANDCLPPVNLIQSAGFSHDLGHPPFGHGGEVALNYCMKDAGGFEGNGHTLRLLAKLEHFSEKHGSDLSRRTMLAVLKYPVSFSEANNSELKPVLNKTLSSIRAIDRKSSKPPKCYFDSEKEVVEWILEPLKSSDQEKFQHVLREAGKHGKAKHRSFDCSIMNLADDIAYGVHDLEDAIALKLVTEKSFAKFVDENSCSAFLSHMKRAYSHECGNDVYSYFMDGLFNDSKRRKRFIGRLVNFFVTNVQIESEDELDDPLIKYSASLPTGHRTFLDVLQKLIEEQVIFTPNVQHLEFKGQKLVVSVFEALTSDPKKLLPLDAYRDFESTENGRRVICDYVAGMTDGFLLKTYDRLFSPRMGSVFDKL